MELAGIERPLLAGGPCHLLNHQNGSGHRGWKCFASLLLIGWRWAGEKSG